MDAGLCIFILLDHMAPTSSASPMTMDETVPVISTSDAQSTSPTKPPAISIQTITGTTTTVTTNSTMSTKNNNGTASVHSSTTPAGVPSNGSSFPNSVIGDETSAQADDAAKISDIAYIFIGISQVVTCTFRISICFFSYNSEY